MRFSRGQPAAPTDFRSAEMRREPRIVDEEHIVAAIDRTWKSSALRTPELTPDVAFLSHHGIPERVLQVSASVAASRGTRPRDELFAAGFDRSRYWAMLAEYLELPFADTLRGVTLVACPDPLTTEAVRHASSALVRMDGTNVLLMAPEAEEIDLIEARLQERPDLLRQIRIAAPEAIRALIVAERHTALNHYAINRLARVLPRLSAREVGNIRTLRGPTTLAAAALALLLLAPSTMLSAGALLVTLFFLNCSIWKLATAFSRHRPLRLEPVPSDRLPAYTVLVPLYREAAIMPSLVQHLRKLDYPNAKLQIILVLEAEDRASREAVLHHADGPPFEVVIVPSGGPRTKPKALTYALPFARGDFVVVFDAEDRPEPDQLRKAAAAFREFPGLGCVQASLAPDNHGSWFARMFAVEYAANFEILLPTLARWQMPLPLGGTSNHFPREVLEQVGAWDPYNVTEDADLGIRLARFGYRSGTILSRTYEEAPIGFRQWLPQRRRWIKGWMQTVAVGLNTDIPKSLRLPLRSRLALHGILTAGVVGMLFYPVAPAMVLIALIAALSGHWPDHVFEWVMITVNLANLAAVLIAAAVSAARGLLAAGTPHLVKHVFFLPFYWALMSFAGWQALLQFFRRPSLWEKTPHGLAADRRTPGSKRPSARRARENARASP